MEVNPTLTEALNFCITYAVSTSDKNTIELLTTFRSVPAYEAQWYPSS